MRSVVLGECEQRVSKRPPQPRLNATFVGIGKQREQTLRLLTGDTQFIDEFGDRTRPSLLYVTLVPFVEVREQRCRERATVDDRAQRHVQVLSRVAGKVGEQVLAGPS